MNTTTTPTMKINAPADLPQTVKQKISELIAGVAQELPGVDVKELFEGQRKTQREIEILQSVSRAALQLERQTGDPGWSEAARIIRNLGLHKSCKPAGDPGSKPSWDVK